jgi:hypothetical protein
MSKPIGIMLENNSAVDMSDLWQNHRSPLAWKFNEDAYYERIFGVSRARLGGY